MYKLNQNYQNDKTQSIWKMISWDLKPLGLVTHVLQLAYTLSYSYVVLKAPFIFSTHLLYTLSIRIASSLLCLSLSLSLPLYLSVCIVSVPKSLLFPPTWTREVHFMLFLIPCYSSVEMFCAIYIGNHLHHPSLRHLQHPDPP